MAGEDSDTETGDGGGGGDARHPDAPRDDVFEELFAVIEDRLRRRPEGSYTASLVDTDPDGDADADDALEKVGEEAVEAILAAKNDDPDALAAESADLVYHLFVALAARGVSLEDLREELRERR